MGAFRVTKSRPRAGSDLKHDRAGLKGQRGRAKKNGGGGHYTWGLAGDEVNTSQLDSGDPLYDSADDVGDDVYVTESVNGIYGNVGNRNKVIEQWSEHGHNDFSFMNSSAESVKPPKMTLSAFKKALKEDLEEFYVSEDFEDFFDSIRGYDSYLLHYELVKRGISISIGLSDRERELTSQLLPRLQLNGLLSTNQAAKGFERLLESGDDLAVDYPKAKKYLAQFIARAIADDVVPPAFLTNEYVRKLDENVVRNAIVLLSVKHGIGRLEHVWHLSNSSKVNDLKREFKMILQEYISSEDDKEAINLLKAMKVDYFHHEFVKRGIITAMESQPAARAQALVSFLLKRLFEEQVISMRQMLLGYQRLFQEISDIQLDNPDAPSVLDIFVEQAVLDGCFSLQQIDAVKQCANRSLDNGHGASIDVSSRMRSTSD